jgi:hypothetical protein
MRRSPGAGAESYGRTDSLTNAESASARIEGQCDWPVTAGGSIEQFL